MLSTCWYQASTCALCAASSSHIKWQAHDNKQLSDVLTGTFSWSKLRLCSVDTGLHISCTSIWIAYINTFSSTDIQSEQEGCGGSAEEEGHCKEGIYEGHVGRGKFVSITLCCVTMATHVTAHDVCVWLNWLNCTVMWHWTYKSTPVMKEVLLFVARQEGVTWGLGEGVTWGLGQGETWGLGEGETWGLGEGVTWGLGEGVTWGLGEGVTWGQF